MSRPLPLILTLSILLLLLSQTVHAQFEQMFNGMFGQQQQQQQHQQRPSNQGTGNNRGWDIQNEASCWNGHVCTGTAACVVSPLECPCPYPEDHKCLLPLPANPSSSGSGTSFFKRKNHPGTDGERERAGPGFVCIRNSGGGVERECERVRRLAGGI